MNLIRQEMSEIQDFDCRCDKKSIPKVITSSLMDSTNKDKQYLSAQCKVPKIHTLSPVKSTQLSKNWL
jgi:hypothetical protein